MGEPLVTVGRQGAVGIITFDNPPVNCYNEDFVRHFGKAVEQVERDPEIRAVVLKSALERFFSAGADLKFLAEGTLASNMEMLRSELGVLARIGRIPKIFIAMLGGHVLGGGLEIALACDLRFSGDGDYRIGLPESTLGLLPGNGGTQRLPRLIGTSRALDLMITGRTLSPAQALALGLVDRVFPQAELEPRTLEYATLLSRGASFAIGCIKTAVNEGIEMPLTQGLARELAETEKVFSSGDAQEGIDAFLGKRRPSFRGG